jgi:hypothetical protein
VWCSLWWPPFLLSLVAALGLYVPHRHLWWIRTALCYALFPVLTGVFLPEESFPLFSLGLRTLLLLWTLVSIINLLGELPCYCRGWRTLWLELIGCLLQLAVLGVFALHVASTLPLGVPPLLQPFLVAFSQGL